MKDPFWQRFQIEFGLGWTLMPNDTVNSSWRRHLFDPWFNLVFVGDILGNPRKHLPKFGAGFVEEHTNDPLKTWSSRCFWLGTGIRLLGLEVGFGVFYRKRYNP